MTVQIARRPFTVTDYARMRETGILKEDDRVELIDGEVRLMSPIGPLHAAIVNRLTALISRHVGDTVILSVQNPIQLHDYSEPQPDLTLLQLRDDFYAQGHPRPDDVLLVIEIADTSIEYDRDEKIPRYAEAGIAEAWLIDLSSQTIEQYTQPRHGGYRNKLIVAFDETITAQALPQLQIVVERIFA
ncbi:MAG TPA: Uma2 family endonuclease [Roseiflexaceae bacterium]